MPNDQLKLDYEAILQYLKENNYILQNLPNKLKAISDEGEAYAIAYPIQGLLKYHGMSNYEHRIANFSSISLNNGAFYTVTYVKFSKKFQKDHLILNGEIINSKDNKHKRISHQLNSIRRYSKINTKALIISRNVIKDSKKTIFGKGLGTSASGGAAISQAAVSILYDKNPEFTENDTLKSLYSRYLAGSATRSTVGGIGLWLNYPNIKPTESIAIRLDKPELHSFINNIDLITISIPSNVQTDQAHEIASLSPFYKTWMSNRKKQIVEFCSALFNKNFQKIAEMSEYDTLQLHAITMTGSSDKNLILWTPETISIMHLTRKLRVEGIPVFFSIDTGPSLVLLTTNDYTKEILENLYKINNDFKINVGKIAGPSKSLKPTSSEAKLLSNDLNQFEDVLK